MSSASYGNDTPAEEFCDRSFPPSLPLDLHLAAPMSQLHDMIRSLLERPI